MKQLETERNKNFIKEEEFTKESFSEENELDEDDEKIDDESSSNIIIEDNPNSEESKKEDDISEEIEKENQRTLDSHNCDIKQKKIQFTVYYYFVLNKKNIFTFPIKSEFFYNSQTVIDLIENIVYQINKKKILIDLDGRKYKLALKEKEEQLFYEENYEILLHKDNCESFMPQYDLPPFSPHALLNNLLNENLCLISKFRENVLLVEEWEEEDDDNEISKKNGNNNICFCSHNCIMF